MGIIKGKTARTKSGKSSSGQREQMNSNRLAFSRMLVVTGSMLLGLGVLLLLVKVLMALAWYASGAIALSGLVLLVIGYLLGGSRYRWQ